MRLVKSQSSVLKDLVKDFGFIPNGTRVYYLDRSQPPLLTDMAMAIFDVTGDKEWLSQATHLEGHFGLLC